MKAEDLRIGNLIYRTNYDMVGRIEYYSERIVNIDILTRLEFGKDYYDSIPLTEKWLFNFGFTKVEEIDLPFECIMYKKDEFALEDDFIVRAMGVEKKLDFVHELQNLYFALTGTELNLKKSE